MKTIIIKVTQEFKEQIEKKAESMEISVSALIRMTMKQKVEE